MIKFDCPLRGGNTDWVPCMIACPYNDVLSAVNDLILDDPISWEEPLTIEFKDKRKDNSQDETNRQTE